jgi:RND family efflux transporter MFP subunit
MKKIVLPILVFMFSCENNNLVSKKKKLDDLKNSLVETYSEIERLEKEIISLDSTYIQKNYELITVSNLNNDPFVHEIELRGNIESKKNVIIVPEVIGKYISVNVTEGQLIEKGALLARINSEVFDNNLNEIKSNLDLLKTIFERQANLWESNIGSEIDYLRAKSNYESIKSRYNATKLQVSKFDIVAPFSGVVDEVNVKVGEMSSPSIPSFRILNDSDYYLSVDVSENYINSFSIDDSVKVISLDDKTYYSRIISLSKVINPINRTFNIGIEIPNELIDNIKPNQILNALLIDYQNNNSLSVSSNIIFNDERGSYVFIVSDFDGEMIAKKIPVLTGRSFKYQTEILSGLTGKELIIDKGSTEVMDGSYVKIKN